MFAQVDMLPLLLFNYHIVKHPLLFAQYNEAMVYQFGRYLR
jgi:hypothetical protein